MNATLSVSSSTASGHVGDERYCGSVYSRYSFRIYPTPGQRRALRRLVAEAVHRTHPR
ncbi:MULTISPECIES: helix-turn-helix domain-containing protein [Nocardia]|uniref:helix-turn-helix domain-containing protein n=1 Tax=Nocardia TaxID=1817 RepID=UPI0035A21B48